MNAGKTARWTTRLIALAMIVVALVAFRVMESQLKRIGEAAERVDARVATEVPVSPAQPITTQLPTPGPKPGEGGEALDSKRVTPEDDPAEAARKEGLPVPGHVPEGAVW